MAYVWDMRACVRRGRSLGYRVRDLLLRCRGMMAKLSVIQAEEKATFLYLKNHHLYSVRSTGFEDGTVYYSI